MVWEALWLEHACVHTHPPAYMHTRTRLHTCTRARARPPCSLQAEFTSLAEWVREKTLFDLISAIGFFRNYLTGRCFRRWLKVGAGRAAGPVHGTA